jgi:hypothetical protein
MKIWKDPKLLSDVFSKYKLYLLNECVRGVWLVGKDHSFFEYYFNLLF